MDSARVRQRAKRKLIRVTFPDGKVICYGNVTDTFIAVLREIGSDRFSDIKLELSHLPILSKEIYPRYKDWMKPVCDGWFLNSQSNTDQKYMQLLTISDALALGLKIEIGDDIEKQGKADKPRVSKTKSKLMVRFPDGEYIANQSGSETFLQCLWKLGIDEVMRKGIEWGGSPLITAFKMADRQIQVDSNRWAIVPGTVKDMTRLLKVIAAHMRLNLEITVI